MGAPGWLNDLTQLEDGRGYWIRASQAGAIHLKNGVAGPVESGALGSAPPLPPSTFYGQVAEGAPGDVVEAWIGDARCGQGATREVAVRWCMWWT